MSIRNKVRLVAAAGLLIAALPVWAKTPHKPALKKVALKSAIIENTGSTNTTGYQIVVSSDGSASYRETIRRGASPESSLRPRIQSLPDDLTKKLFADLAAAGPLASLTARHAMKSASFGTETFITYKGQRSPDLSFPASPQGKALSEDITAITQGLNVRNAPRFRLP